jgi:hypothetical protein
MNELPATDNDGFYCQYRAEPSTDIFLQKKVREWWFRLSMAPKWRFDAIYTKINKDDLKYYCHNWIVFFFTNLCSKPPTLVTKCSFVHIISFLKINHMFCVTCRLGGLNYIIFPLERVDPIVGMSKCNKLVSMELD